MEGKNKILSKQSLVDLVLFSVIPASWTAGLDVISYGTLANLFDVVEENDLSSNVIVEALNKLTGRDVASIIKKPSNYVKKMKGYIKRNIYEMCKDEEVTDLHVDDVLSPSMSLGPFCDQVEISIDLINDITQGSTAELMRKSLKNGTILELEKYRKKSNTTWKCFTLCLTKLMGEDGGSVSHEAVKLKIESMKSKKGTLMKASRVEEIENYLSLEFLLPSKKSDVLQNVLSSQSDTDMEALQKKISKLLDINSELELKFHYTCLALKEESDSRHSTESDFKILSNKFMDLKRHNEKVSAELVDKMSKLSTMSTRNVNKRIKRIKEKSMSLQECLDERLQKNILLEEDVKCLNEKLTEALQAGLKCRKKNSYLKNKFSNLESSSSYNESYVANLKNQILVLENEKLELEEKIEEFMRQEISVYKNGSYDDSVRMVYEDLLCMGLSTRNVEKVIRIVLEKLAGISVDKLPKPTFAKYMLIEARGLAQMHVAAELAGSDLLDSSTIDDNNLDSSIASDTISETSSTFRQLAETSTCSNNNNNTLHSDGTSKKGNSFITYDINKSGKTLVTGLREVGGTDALTQLEIFKDVLSDIGDLISSEDSSSFVNNVFASIKNTMSDRCSTQKKFNTLFSEYRKSILPSVIKNWSNLSEDEQKSFAVVNDFFCGLHFLVGLADQAEACLKVYENLLIGNDNKVGSLAHGGYSNGESGTTRLIRTVCKSVQKQGCEKSGRMVTFAGQMKEEYGMDEIPLYPFFGNRFNILFLNGAGVYFLYEKLVSFMSLVEKDNKLLNAVFYDLQVLPHRVGCRALGLIHKLVTGPLWRKMESEKNALNMTLHYQKMVDLFQKWANDSSPFLNGSESLFPDLVHKDELFTKLTSANLDLDDMTKQCLEMIFSSFVLVSKRMLHDHLSSGKFSSPTSSLIRESEFVPTTNADAERDFGMLDRLMKLKPKALDLVYEGIIMFNRNKTREWRNSLSNDQLSFVMKKARESKSVQMKKFFKRKALIHQQRVDLFKNKLDEKERKEREASAEKERLVRQIEEFGGLWDANVIDESLEKYSSVSEKRLALKVQLSFRQKVLSVKCERSLFFMSSGGVNRSVDELKGNLLAVIGYSSLPSPPLEADISPILSIIPEDVLDSEKQRYLKEADICESKLLNKNKKRAASSSTKARKKKKTTDEQLPIVSSPDDLIGKLILHLTSLDGEEDDWYKGVILKKAGGSKVDPKYLVKYNDSDELFCHCLYDDLKNQTVFVLPVSADDFINASILHLYTDEEAGNDTWWPAQVVDVDIESEDNNNPDFFVLYDDEDKESETEYFLSPLVQDYYNGWVRFTDYPSQE